MRKILIPLFILLVDSAKAQIAHVAGRVVDDVTKSGVAGATIKLGEKSLVADAEGYFNITLNAAALETDDLTISAIGYNSKEIPLKAVDVHSFLLIRLPEKYNDLPGVTVTVHKDYAVNIVRTAIAAIPANYLQTPFNLLVFQESRETVNDSVYVFRNDALIKTWYDPRGRTEDDIQIRVLQNKQDQHYLHLKDTSTTIRHWFGANREISAVNVIYYKPDYIEERKLKDFNYQFKKLTTYQNRNVYVIDFTSRADRNYTGTLFIDTLSHAFVGIYILKVSPKIYSGRSILMSYKSTYNATRITYAEHNGTWLFNHMESEHRVYVKEKDSAVSVDRLYSNILLVRADSLQPEEIRKKDQEDKVSFQFRDLVKGDPKNWDSIESQLGIKTLREGNIKPLSGFFKNYVQYLLGGGLRVKFGVTTNPYKVNVSSIANYGISGGLQLRVFRQLFLGFESTGNFGIGNVRTGSTLLGLSYDINLYGHRLYFLPSSGLSFFQIKDKGHLLEKHNDLFGAGALGYRFKGSTNLLFFNTNYTRHVAFSAGLIWGFH